MDDPYINGVTSEEWKKKRREILKRDDNMCQIIRTSDLEKCNLCPKTKVLDVHHIDLNPCNNESDNLIVLCRTHHFKMHRLLNDIDDYNINCGKVQLRETLYLLLKKRCFSEAFLDILSDVFIWKRLG